MRIDSIFVLFFVGLLTLAGTHQLALWWYLYWVYEWFDIPMHFLGGVVIALGSRTELFERIMRLSFRSVWPVIGLVLAIGILWEVFEWFFVITDMRGYVVDTTIDLVLDLLGGVVGYYIASSFKKYLPA